MKIQSFIKDIVSTYQKGKVYDKHSKQFTDCINELQLDKDTLELKLKTSELLLSQAIQDITSIENSSQNAFNSVTDDLSEAEVLSLASIFESKMEDKPFKYNYDQKGSKDIKRYLKVSTQDKELINTYANKILRLYSTETPQEAVGNVQDFFAFKERNTYTADPNGDVWDYINFLTTFKDDCDSVAGAIHVIIQEIFTIKGWENHKQRLWFTVNNNYKERHANNIWLGDDGFFYTVESTMDLKGTFKRKWLNVKIKDDSFYTSYDAFANSSISHKGSKVVWKDFRGEL